MLPMTQYLLNLTQTDDIAKAEQILVGTLVPIHGLAWDHDTEGFPAMARLSGGQSYVV